MRILLGRQGGKFVFLMMLVAAFLVGVSVCAPRLHAQSFSGGAPWTHKFEDAIRTRSAEIKLRKIKTRGKPKVARWEDVDAQLAATIQLLDAKTLLQDLHPALQGGAQQLTFEHRAGIDQLLAGLKLSYNKLFVIEDDEAYFPLTNNVLRLTGDDGLADLDVFEKGGFNLGKYAGKYIFEKTGGFSYGGGNYRLTFFQYRDNEGNLRPSGNTNLLDTYTIRWKDVKDRAFLQLSADALFR